jgi:hypothetical protein
MEYKAITALNTAGVQGWVAEGSAASTLTTSTEDVTAVYKSQAWGDKVTFESQWAGQGFMDHKAMAVTNLLRAALIAEENAILFGQLNGSATPSAHAPGAVGAPSNPTLAVAGTDGLITAATYWIRQTVLTGMGESLPSTGTSIAVGSTEHMTIAPVRPAAQPVIGYKFYWSATENGTYSEITGDDISGGAVSNGLLPGGTKQWYTNGDTITVLTLTTGNDSYPIAEAASSAYSYNGIFPQMVGGTGATLRNAVSAGSGPLTVAHINALLKSLWDDSRADPDNIFCNAQESVKLNALTLGAGAPYYLVVDKTEGATVGYRVARYTNAVTGSELPVRVHPTIPQGLMLFLSSKLPSWYVPTDIPNVWCWDGPQDYVEIDYPPTQGYPYWQVEVRLYGAVKVYMPLLQGALHSISNA